VAGRLRAEGIDRQRRGKDRRARKESGELRPEAPYSAIRQLAKAESNKVKDRNNFGIPSTLLSGFYYYLTFQNNARRNRFCLNG